MFKTFSLLQLAFAPLLLERKANRIRKARDAEKAEPREIRSIYDSADRR